MQTNQWVKAAIEFRRRTEKGFSGAELARRLTEHLGRSIDRAAVNKMQNPPDAPKRQSRKVSSDEMMAIAEITGFPLPVPAAPVTLVPLVSWVAAGRLSEAETVMPHEVGQHVSVAGLHESDWIALEVDGDSMDRVAPPGAIILVDRGEREPRDRCFYVFRLDDTATFKRYRAAPPRLEPFSHAPHDAIFPDEGLRIVGRVRRIIMDL